MLAVEKELRTRIAGLEHDLARQIATCRALEDRCDRLEADLAAIQREHSGGRQIRSTMEEGVR